MPEPDQPAPDSTGPGPALSVIIDISDWLVRQGGGIAHTPGHLVAWLHERIAAVAADPALVRAARLADVDEHRTLFSARLEDALAAGWDTHQLAGVDVFDRYDGDEIFRAQLNAAAGIAAYTAVRADRALPDDQYWAAAVVPAQRQRQLIKAIEDHAPRYAAAGLRPARYIAEAHVPGGATRTEWDWIAYHLAAHPEVLHRPGLSQEAIDRRDHTLAERFDQQALEAFNAGDHQQALDLIDEAELHEPRRDWDTARAHIRQHMPTRNGAGPVDNDPAVAADEAGPAAATAFQRPPRNVPPRQAPTDQPAAGPPPPTAPESARRSTHR